MPIGSGFLGGVQWALEVHPLFLPGKHSSKCRREGRCVRPAGHYPAWWLPPSPLSPLTALGSEMAGSVGEGQVALPPSAQNDWDLTGPNYYSGATCPCLRPGSSSPVSLDPIWGLGLSVPVPIPTSVANLSTLHTGPSSINSASLTNSSS